MAKLLGKLATGLALQAFLATPSVCESIGVAVKFEKYTRSKHAGVVQLSKRASNPYSVTIDNAVQSYVINVTIGSNSQPFNLILDTGSSDLWVPSTDNNYCEADSSDCPYGTFQPSQSTSFTNTSEEFYIRYGDGTEEVGYYFEDTLKISDLSLTNVTMAVAIASNSQTAIQGIMGIGFTSNEASNSSAREQLGLTPSQPFTYPSVIDNMVSQGKISARAYSLWLDDLNSFTGTILFGGVDSSKYTGPLVALPIQNDAQSGTITSFTVALTSLVVDFGNGKTDDISPSSALPALLDSGTTLTYLPETIATAIGNGVGAVYDQTLGPIANCTIAANNVSFVYGFGGKNGPTISVSLSSLLTPIVDENYDPITYPDGTPICQWGILPADENGVILGDSFLRSAYVVYDLENLEIGLAQTNFNAGQDSKNAKAISSGSIPGVSSTASGPTVQQTATGEPRASERTRATSTGTAPIGVATFPLSTTGTVGPSGTLTGSSGSASSTSKNAGISQGSLAGSGMYHVLTCVLAVLVGAMMW